MGVGVLREPSKNWSDYTPKPVNRLAIQFTDYMYSTLSLQVIGLRERPGNMEKGWGGGGTQGFF